MDAGRIDTSSWQGLTATLRSHIGRRVGNAADRDDLVQDVLLRVHRSYGALKKQMSAGAWIARIADNAVIDFWRRGKKPAMAPAAMTDVDAAEIAGDSGEGDHLQQALAAYVARSVTSLPSPYRETLTLTELQGVKYAAAAEMLGVSLAAVKSRVLRGRMILKQSLRENCDLEIGATGRVIACSPGADSACTDSCQGPNDAPT
jgi:RNA polymerase sigma-70 factor (ECF subfamily)